MFNMAVYDKLEWMIQSDEHKKNGVVAAGMIIEKLRQIETDDDYFPYSLIEVLESLLKDAFR